VCVCSDLLKNSSGSVIPSSYIYMLLWKSILTTKIACPQPPVTEPVNDMRLSRSRLVCLVR